MDEIHKRFEIIRLAIQLGDYDTILVQCKQLPKISMDAHLSDIIALLKSKNYRQALYEMRYYAQNLDKSFYTMSNQPPKDDILPPEDTAPPTPQPQANEKVIGLDEIMQMADDTKQRVKEYQATPEFPTQEILDEFKGELEKAREKRVSTESQMVEDRVYQDKDGVDLPLSEPDSMKNAISDDIKVEVDDSDDNIDIEKIGDDKIVIEEDSSQETQKAPTDNQNITRGSSSLYQPISYIDQKYNNMIYQYPPVEDEGVFPDEVKEMKERLSIREYSDEDVEEFLDYYFKYQEAGQKEQASKVLLLAASTESKFAKLLLARELFKGEILKKNETEAFNLINSLADQNYPEAICDLGQFYEYGIAIVKDKQMALLLYKEASDLGVERAKKLYERLKGSKSMLGILKKLDFAKKIIKKD